MKNKILTRVKNALGNKDNLPLTLERYIGREVLIHNVRVTPMPDNLKFLSEPKIHAYPGTNPIGIPEVPIEVHEAFENGEVRRNKYERDGIEWTRDGSYYRAPINISDKVKSAVTMWLEDVKPLVGKPANINQIIPRWEPPKWAPIGEEGVFYIPNTRWKYALGFNTKIPKGADHLISKVGEKREIEATVYDRSYAGLRIGYISFSICPVAIIELSRLEE